MNKDQIFGYFLSQFLLYFRFLTFAACKNGQAVTEQEWRGLQFLDHQQLGGGRRFAWAYRRVNQCNKSTVKRLNVEINI